MQFVKDAAKTALKLLLGRGSFRSFSQFGEDAIVRTQFRGRNEGIYVDVGAYHPTLYSNTYALYRRGWSGIAVDPNGAMRPLFRLFRPRDSFVCAAVDAEPADRLYRSYVDGAYNTFSDEQAKVLAARSILPRSTSSLPVRPLRELLAPFELKRIDFMNIDVEGMDEAVLESHDWNIRPRVLAVEIHGFDPDAPQESGTYRFLREKGYALIGIAGLTVLFKDQR